jgi:hypothetical protein
VPIYSSKIIKAGALLADTKTLLVHWNTSDPAQVNLDRLRRENVFGKVSRSRVKDVLSIFGQRVLGEEGVTKALVVLAQKRLPAATINRILYFHAAQADRLLHDTVTEILLPLQARGVTHIDVRDIQRPLSLGDSKMPVRRQNLARQLRQFGANRRVRGNLR